MNTLDKDLLVEEYMDIFNELFEQDNKGSSDIMDLNEIVKLVDSLAQQEPSPDQLIKHMLDEADISLEDRGFWNE